MQAVEKLQLAQAKLEFLRIQLKISKLKRIIYEGYRSFYFRLVGKRLLFVCLPILIYFLHEFLGVVLGRHGNFCLNLLFRVGIGFYMCSVHKHYTRRQVSRFRYFRKNPRKNLVHRLCGKPVAEVLADR